MLVVALALLVSVAVAPDPNDAAPCGTLAAILQGGCSVATEHAAFVECNTVTKTCYCLPTFSGNASINNKCRCPEPKNVYLSASLSLHLPGQSALVYGTPYCFNKDFLLAQQAAQQAVEERNERHIAAVVEFFNNTIGTKPTQILMPGGNQHLHSILSENVKSRISPAGEFDGFEGVVEYFYGFVANPALRVLNVDYRSIAASGNIVAAKANILLNNQRWQQTLNHPPEFWNLTTFAFFTFDTDDKIASIDVSVPNLGAVLDIPDSLGPAAPLIRAGIIANTCDLMLNSTGPAGGRCNLLPPVAWGANPQWNGATDAQKIQDCIGFMMSRPYGTRERHNDDNFVCRSLHSILIPFRPNPHCFHSSKSGGGACVPTPYSDYYLKDY